MTLNQPSIDVTDAQPALDGSRTRRYSRLAALLLAFGLLAAACGSDGSDRAADDGRLSPDDDSFLAPYDTFGGGTNTIQAVAEGKPVVLNFFASTCVQCIKEMPDFEEVSQAFADDVTFVGLATSDREEDAAPLVDSTGVTYPVGLDESGAFFEVFGGLGMPTTVFLGADGEVKKVWTGALTQEALTDLIQEQLL